MNWVASIGRQTFTVELPRDLVSGQVFQVKVSNKTYDACWDAAERSLSLKSPDDRTWKQLTLRRAQLSQFPGETETNVSTEFFTGHHMHTAAVALTPHIPGLDSRASGASKSKVVRAPMSGKIIQVCVAEGDTVKSGDLICTIEAMKMENRIEATSSGVVGKLAAEVGKTVSVGFAIAEVTPSS